MVLTTIISLVALGGMVFGTVIWGTLPNQNGPAPERIVPNLSGKTRTQAEASLLANDLNGEFTGTGHVSAQAPSAGSESVYGAYVSVTLS